MSNPSIDPAMLETIKSFVELLKAQPSLIFSPDLKFLREYLTAMGARIPIPKVPPPTDEHQKSGAGDSPKKPTGYTATSSTKSTKVEDVVDEEMEEPEEPFPDLPQDGVVAEDELDSNQEMGGSEGDVSEESMDKSNDLRMEAAGLFGDGKFQESVDKYTEAIKLNGQGAILFAKRGQAFLKLEKANACIKDCSRALELNPDSAVAYKFRGRAHRLLGHWEESANDLRQAVKIDFDEQADEWL